MARYTRTQVTQLSANEQAAINNINKNFEDLESAIQDTVSRSGNTPTHMTHDLDMNSYRIINVPAPTVDTDIVRRKDVVEDMNAVKLLVNTATNASAQALEAAQAVQEVLEDSHVVIVADDLALGENSNIIKVANDIGDVSNVADNMESINTANNNITNIDTVADNISNVNSVGSSISNINSCANNMSAIIDAPNQASAAAGSANAASVSAQEAARSAASCSPILFDHKWEDHLVNHMAWLRADTFSWHDGTVYSEAYNHLVDDLDDIELVETQLYGWTTSTSSPFGYGVYTKSEQSAILGIYDTHAKQYGTSSYYTIHSVFISNDVLTVTYILSGQSTTRTVTFNRDSTKDHIAENFPADDPRLVTETVGINTITYFQADDGHKIVVGGGIDTVYLIYQNSGAAWYYCLDTVYHRFRLPCENPDKEILALSAPVVGNGMVLGMTDGSDYGGLELTQYSNLASHKAANAVPEYYGTQVGSTFATRSDFSTNNTGIGVTQDPSKSGLVAKLSSKTGVYKGKQYLYFYVGQFSQSATEQTAGLNAELFNGKADRDLQNTSSNIDFVIENYQNGSDWYRLYRSGYVEQGGSFSSGGSGNKTVTLLIEMADSNYKTKATRISGASTTTNVNVWAREATSTTQFVIYTSGDTGVVWEVKGMSA